MDRTILVADDEPTIRDLLAEVLHDEGYAVVTAPDGAAALEAAERTRPDLVLSDVTMPGADGVAVAQRLRERGIPVVLMSAAGRCPALPGVPCIAKPFDLGDVVAAVDRALGWAWDAGSPAPLVQPGD